MQLRLLRCFLLRLQPIFFSGMVMRAPQQQQLMWGAGQITSDSMGRGSKAPGCGVSLLLHVMLGQWLDCGGARGLGFLA